MFPQERMTGHTDAETIPVRAGEELPLAAVERYVRERIDGLGDAPLEVEQFRAGRSNLTYLLRIGDWEAVLRRPPFGDVAPKAHDMGREYRILRELHDVFPLAPKPYLFCDDPSVIGSPFFVMERRRGVVLDSGFPAGVQVTPDLCAKLSEAMVDTLVQLHGIDYQKTGLAEFVRPDGFLERQVRGWIARYERAKTDDVPGVAQLTAWLLANIPPSPDPTLIHYDFKCNNLMFAREDLTRVVAVFDWEMSTVGDPLADLGAAMSYWLEPGDPDALRYGFGEPPVTVTPGFYTRQQFLEAYAKKSGRDLSHIGYYLTFASFKLAVICQQIYYRYRLGQTRDERFAAMGALARALIESALERARRPY